MRVLKESMMFMNKWNIKPNFVWNLRYIVPLNQENGYVEHYYNIESKNNFLLLYASGEDTGYFWCSSVSEINDVLDEYRIDLIDSYFLGNVVAYEYWD